jgi:hypothetical protein
MCRAGPADAALGESADLQLFGWKETVEPAR